MPQHVNLLCPSLDEQEQHNHYKQQRFRELKDVLLPSEFLHCLAMSYECAEAPELEKDKNFLKCYNENILL